MTTKLPDTPFALTDFGNAERLIFRYGERFHYCGALHWLLWDGQRWEEDGAEAKILRAAWLTIRLIKEEASLIEAIPTPDNPKDTDGTVLQLKKQMAIIAWGTACENGSHVETMVKRSQCAQGIWCKASDFDADLNQFNTVGGIIDLRDGSVRPQTREDMVTKISPIEFKSDATCPLWEKFLLEVMDGKQLMVDFLQRFLGYSLTGEISEHKMAILWGSGANGKTTMLEVVRHVMGDYAQAAEFNTFISRKDVRSGPSSDIAKMRGARFVSAVEGEKSHALAESLIKQLTGGDTITACFKFKEYFEFKPQFKLWLATNHKPTIKGTDDGIWRRISLIPFNVSFIGREDENLTDKLKAEAPGILAWMVRGLAQWREHGLMEPDEVKQATADYRANEDTIMRFIQDECEVGPEFRESASVMNNRYNSWVSANHEPEKTTQAFGDEMREHGFPKRRMTAGQFYLRIKCANRSFGGMVHEDELENTM